MQDANVIGIQRSETFALLVIRQRDDAAPHHAGNNLIVLLVGREDFITAVGAERQAIRSESAGHGVDQEHVDLDRIG